VSGQAKVLIDRTIAISGIPGLRNKAAGVLLTMEESGATSALAAFNSISL